MAIMDNIIQLRTVDRKRLDGLQERTETPLAGVDIWYIHTVLAQCFLPYRDPKTHDWTRKNGHFSIALMAGHVESPDEPGGMRIAGLPYGAKPRLFQSYVCTQVIKQQSPVVPVERSMTAMMHELGLQVSGGKEGTIRAFKDQITRFAACHFTIVGPGPRGTRTHIKTPPIKKFDVWFPPDPKQQTLWPSEIVLTDEYYYSLKDHAIPYDFRALKAIQNKPRAQDIYLWMTQRLCRIEARKPLLMRWPDLYEMFGGQSSSKEFKRNFPQDLLAARTSYPDARIEEHQEGYLFRASPTPIPRTPLFVK
jgi:Plasmid encoded RepA protein